MLRVGGRFITLWASKKHFCHLERSYLLLSCGIGYNVLPLTNDTTKRRNWVEVFRMCLRHV